MSERDGLLGRVKPTWWGDFKAFLSRGSVFDLAIGLIIGSAFGGIVTSFTNDIISPPLGLLLGTGLSNYFVILKYGKSGPNAVYNTLDEAKEDGAITENWGSFVQVIINFVVVAFALFWIIRVVSSLNRKENISTTKICPDCVEEVNIKARKCKFCAKQFN